MMARPSSSTAMMNVSRSCPSGIIGLIAAAWSPREAAAPGAGRIPSADMPGIPGVAVSSGGFDGSAFRRIPSGIHRFGYVPPSRTPGSELATGVELALFGLRRVDVDVDHIRCHLEEQMDLRTALFDGCHAVRIDDRVRDGSVLHDPAIDEHVLRAASRSLLGEGSNESREPQPGGLLAHVADIVAVAV